MKLILVRHGNTFEKGETSRIVGAKTDLVLTEFGKKQAENVADFIIRENLLPTAAFHGTLKRQKETASIICKRLALNNLMECGELSEVDYGQWENLTADEIKFMWPQEYSLWAEQGEWPKEIFKQSEETLLNSLEKWLLQLAADYASQNVMAVSSNGILKLLNKIILKEKYDFKKSKVRTGAVCLIEIKRGNASVMQWDYLP